MTSFHHIRLKKQQNGTQLPQYLFQIAYTYSQLLLFTDIAIMLLHVNNNNLSFSSNFILKREFNVLRQIHNRYIQHLKLVIRIGTNKTFSIITSLTKSHIKNFHACRQKIMKEYLASCMIYYFLWNFNTFILRKFIYKIL